MELPRRVGVCADAAGRQRHERAEFVTQLYKNVPVLDAGARGSTNTFAQRGIGDVLLAWENEAYLAVDESKGRLDIVAPPTSILAEPPVAVVDWLRTSAGPRRWRRRTWKILASPEGQELAAKHHYRPRDPNVLKEISSVVRRGQAVYHRRRVRRLASGQ